MAFVAWHGVQAPEPRPALIVVGFAAQWIPWARIDRAAFQYHYYTALPFLVIALAYFLAELWHGASRHDLAARPGRRRRSRSSARPCMWLLDRPLCGVRRRRLGQPRIAGLPGGIPDFVLTYRTAAPGHRRWDRGLIVIVRGFLRPAGRRRIARTAERSRRRRLMRARWSPGPPSSARCVDRRGCSCRTPRCSP